ncbi:MAG: TIGR04086 family membrane protein [Ruminococcus sp.]|uniref:TIGR04086 family membrane protein n=1 Tax=Ruminococcus flavefaciens TaxID=1265 RepID=UPI00156961B5|nr:TIGR04086 family membrane protein [Ruminococcus flavefaciens]MBR0512367.1 TIGR04086 family membrane protein [Ruminococcus sp.]
MRRHRKSLWANGAMSMAAAVLLGLGSAAAAAALLAALLFYVMKDMAMTGAFAGAALAAGAYTGAFVYGKYRRRKGLFGGSMCGAFMYAVISAWAIAAAGGFPDIKKLLLLTAFGAAGGVAGVNSKRPEKLRDQ